MEKSAQPQLYLGKIENLNASYPNWPFVLVRLGKVYLLLEDLHGALEQFEKALRLLSPLQDDKFAQYVEGLRAYIMVTMPHFVVPLLDTEQEPFPLERGGRRRYDPSRVAYATFINNIY